MRTSLMCLLTLIALLSNSIDGQTEVPCWVPEEALVTAQRYWDTWMKEYNLTSLWHDFGLTSRNEALSCILKDPFRVVRLDYENYKDDSSLSPFLSSSRVPHDSTYGFGIYHGDSVVGHICVYYRDNSWRLMELRGYGKTPRGDLFAPIYGKYPIASGYVIYREDWTGTFFVFRDHSFVEAFTQDDLGDRLCKSIEPREYLRKEKERIVKGREIFQK